MIHEFDVVTTDLLLFVISCFFAHNLFFKFRESEYFFNKKSFKDSGNKRIGLLPKMFEINSVEAIDIDTVEDFLIAESIFNIKNNNDE